MTRAPRLLRALLGAVAAGAVALGPSLPAQAARPASAAQPASAALAAGAPGTSALGTSATGTSATGVGQRLLGPALPAANAEDFQAGNIISDHVFFDPGTMTVTQVQQFLDARGAACEPNDEQGDLPCLKDIRVATVEKAADDLCRGYTGGQTQSAAQIIVGVALSCDINPRVLLVLLEKEQSLVTRKEATTYAYERATGFGCPDTAPCNTEYFGLFNQLYLAGRQYQNYAANPTRYPNYRPGRLNYIQYHPNKDCGGSQVYIENQATAGLYTYTPYQPNASVMKHLYTAVPADDPLHACSAYGNRNFWRLFTDWFGSTQGGGFLVRTAEDPRVYLISGDTKHPVPTPELLNAYAPLGPVGNVSQLYLDRRTTGSAVNRVVRGADGAFWYVDGGRKHYIGTCDLVTDFRGSCAAYIQLTQVQTDALATGGNLRPTVRTSSGRLFHVDDGVKREAADGEALAAAGLPTSALTLTDAAVAGLPYGDPVVRPGIVLRDRADGDTFLSSSAGIAPVPAAMLSGTVLRDLPVRDLDAASTARLDVSATPVGPFVRSGSAAHLLRGSSITRLPDAAVLPAAMASVGAETLAGFTATGDAPSPLVVQPVGDPLRYQVVGGQRRPVRSDAELTAIGGAVDEVLAVTPLVAGLMPVGPDAAATQFSDVRLTHVFAGDILWLAASGITTGHDDGTFRPGASVTREAMAAFLWRRAGEPAPPDADAPRFTDVPAGHPFHAAIEWLAAEGISTGWEQEDGTAVYLPGQPVSREAMAAFLYRVAGEPEFTAPVEPRFADVGTGHPFYAAIEWLASVEVTRGSELEDGTLVYTPAGPVTREAMAAFLHRFDAL